MLLILVLELLVWVLKLLISISLKLIWIVVSFKTSGIVLLDRTLLVSLKLILRLTWLIHRSLVHSKARRRFGEIHGRTRVLARARMLLAIVIIQVQQDGLRLVLQLVRFDLGTLRLTKLLAVLGRR